jgi:HipA-like C-terminal domain
MNTPFPITDVTAWPTLGEEPMGTKPKCWLRQPSLTESTSGESTEPKWLFKEKARQQSEDDWTEKVSCELAVLLGLPHATVQLATRHGKRGIITRDLVVEFGAEELIPGNRLLVEIDPSYPQEGFYRMAQHTLSRIFRVFAELNIGLPPQSCFGEGVVDAFDLFVGYLMFDAWIANTDRHHENWAALKYEGANYTLSPSYDHAASLGHNVPDTTREEKLNRIHGSGVAEFVSSPKVRSALYRNETDTKPISPLEAFKLAAESRPQSARFWQEKLRVLNENDATDILYRVPDAIITHIAREFADRILRLNRARLLAFVL